MNEQVKNEHVKLSLLPSEVAVNNSFYGVFIQMTRSTLVCRFLLSVNSNKNLKVLWYLVENRYIIFCQNFPCYLRVLEGYKPKYKQYKLHVAFNKPMVCNASGNAWALDIAGFKNQWCLNIK